MTYKKAKDISVDYDIKNQIICAEVEPLKKFFMYKAKNRDCDSSPYAKDLYKELWAFKVWITWNDP